MNARLGLGISTLTRTACLVTFSGLLAIMPGLGRATIPDAAGVIHGCYSVANGNQRIIDTSVESCKKNEVPIQWSQTGPQGPVGPQGPQGSQGLQGPQGVPGTPGSGSSDVYSITGPSVGLRIIFQDVATLNVPAGQYWIMFTSTVTNTTADLINPTDTIGCAIVGVGSVNTVRLGPDANQAVMALQTVASFSAPTTITVGCAGFTLQFSGHSDNNVLTALKVGAIH
jgi:hypothetical protein